MKLRIMERRLCLGVAAVAVSCGLVGVPDAVAQQPPAAPPAPAVASQTPPPPTGWTGDAAFGLSLNRGNTSTTNVNASFDLDYGLKTADTWTFKGLYLRGKDNDTLAVDRLDLEGRDERSLTDRVYDFGQLQFIRDKFKDIDYLWAPSGGIGYHVLNTPTTTLNADGGLGLQIEQYTQLARHTDAVVTASDALTYKLSPTATITQGFDVLWKVQDFGDALYTITGGIASAITPQTQLKAELLDTYASKPPVATLKSNDIALLMAIVYKF